MFSGSNLFGQKVKFHAVTFVQVCDIAGAPYNRSYARQTDYEKNEYMSDISPTSGSLAVIMRSFKSAVTRNIRLAWYDFAWQRNVWEHIIRDFDDYARIADCINNNSAN